MRRFRTISIGYKLAGSFFLVIALGLAGYFNTVRAMQNYIRHNREMQKVINDSISLAQDASVQSHDTSSDASLYVYTRSEIDLEHKWQTNEAAKQDFGELQDLIGKLPNNQKLRALEEQAQNQEENVCNPLEKKALDLTRTGHQFQALQALGQVQRGPAELGGFFGRDDAGDVDEPALPVGGDGVGGDGE